MYSVIKTLASKLDNRFGETAPKGYWQNLDLEIRMPCDMIQCKVQILSVLSLVII